jgi:opacity protein-like surface antigen
MRNRFIVAVLSLTLIFGAAITADSAMYFGTQFGPNFNSSMDVKVNAPFVNNTLTNMKARTGFTSGLLFGYDFVNYGTGAYPYPDWMKYFGVMVDVSYTQMNFSSQGRLLNSGQTVFTPGVDGSNVALTFLLAAKVPCVVSADYPNGRLNPYVGVGPSLMFTSMDFSNFGGSSNTSTNIGLVAEAGVRYMITPAFSADVAYRYRYMYPSMSFTAPGIGNVTVGGPVNNSQVIMRLAYHF